MNHRLSCAFAVAAFTAAILCAEETPAQKPVGAAPSIKPLSTPAYLSDAGTRKLPENYVPLETFLVTIALDKTKIEKNTLLYEELPEGWQLIGSHPSWSTRPFRHLYVWKFTGKKKPDEIRYALIPPLGFKMEKEFNGFFQKESGFRSNIAGTRYIYLKQ